MPSETSEPTAVLAEKPRWRVTSPPRVRPPARAREPSPERLVVTLASDIWPRGAGPPAKNEINHEWAALAAQSAPHVARRLALRGYAKKPRTVRVVRKNPHVARAFQGGCAHRRRPEGEIISASSTSPKIAPSPQRLWIRRSPAHPQGLRQPRPAVNTTPWPICRPRIAARRWL